MADVEVGPGAGVGDAVRSEDLVIAGIGVRGVDLGLHVLTDKEGITFELGLDIGLELDVGQLQKLDRLLQLGRDDQPLSLTNL
jgi:hypothetical protein